MHNSSMRLRMLQHLTLCSDVVTWPLVSLQTKMQILLIDQSNHADRQNLLSLLEIITFVSKLPSYLTFNYNRRHMF